MNDWERWNDEHKAMKCLICGGTNAGEPEDYHRPDCDVVKAWCIVCGAAGYAPWCVRGPAPVHTPNCPVPLREILAPLLANPVPSPIIRCVFCERYPIPHDVDPWMSPSDPRLHTADCPVLRQDELLGHQANATRRSGRSITSTSGGSA